jgi:melanoma-associated antigen
MRYVLFKTHQTSGCPIKREELTGIVTRNYRQRALPALVINEARDRLAATFGYEMRELQRTRAPSTRSARQPPCKRNQFFSFLFPPSYHRHRSIHFQLMACHLDFSVASVDAKSYVLVSKLDTEVYSKHVEDKESARLSGLALVVVSIVHLAGGKISQGKWSNFRKLVTANFSCSESRPSENCRGPLASVEAARFT